MSVVFNKLSGDNDSLYGKIQAPLRQIIVDNANKDTDDGKLLRLLFEVEDSDNWAEAGTGQTGLGTMKPKNELGKVDADEVMETYPKTIEHVTFFNELNISAEMLEDAKGGSAIRKARPLYAQFGESYVRSQAEFATTLLSNGTSTTATFNGKTFDTTTGDGLPIFSKVHKCKKTGTASNSNLFSNAFGSDSTMLNRLANRLRNQKNDTGNITKYLADTIIIPGNCYALEDTIKKIISSENVAGSNHNDMNTQRGLWSLIVDPYWQAEDGTAPYIIMSSKAKPLGSKFFNRTKLHIKEDVNKYSDLTMVARARFSAGFFDWRHMLIGGVSGGTTLS